MNKHLLPIYVLLPISLGFCFSAFITQNKEGKNVTAISDTETDMSKVAILSNESIDTSHIIYDDFSSENLNNNWVVSHRKWGEYGSIRYLFDES